MSVTNSTKVARRVGIISLNLHVDHLPFAASNDYMRHFGANLGNLAFVYAVTQHILGEKKLFSSVQAPLHRLSEHFDALVFPAANNIRPDADLLWLSDIIEKSQLPVAIVGLGVQAPKGATDLVVPPGTERFLALVRERRIPIGVRGSFTKRFLEGRGIETAEVIGCPSNFINPNTQLGQQIAQGFARVNSRSAIALNLEYFGPEKEKVKALTDLLRKQGGFAVFQSDTDLVAQIRRDPDLEMTKSRLEYYAKYFLGSTNGDDFEAFVAQYARLFIHVPSWLDVLRSVDLSIGTRFHGNMMATQVGRPAIVFTHDARTQELCEATGIPSLPWESVKAPISLDEILSQIRFDPEAYDRNRQSHATRYVAILRHFGFDVDAKLVTLASESQT